MNKDFSTNDLNLASALLTFGFELLDLDRSNPSRVRFVFRKADGLSEAIDSFWDNSLNLPAQELLAAQRQLKNRLYAGV